MLEESPVSDLITEELRTLRNNVPGVRGSITATTDGLLVAHDLPGLEPTQLAALVAALHAVAVRASLSTQVGQFREVITRGGDGYLAVYAAGGAAIVGVLGVSDMNLAMLNLQARKVIEHISQHAAGLVRRPQDPSPQAGLAAPPASYEQGPPLPSRRPTGEWPQFPG
jgi:predicted regulator of Ras-like GTPase activity (Roadblock/LC7/MglB family)